MIDAEQFRMANELSNGYVKDLSEAKDIKKDVHHLTAKERNSHVQQFR